MYPLRNQFQMLFATKGEFEVRSRSRMEGIEGLPQKIHTFSQICTLSKFCGNFKMLLIGVTVIVLQNTASSTAIFSLQPTYYKQVLLCMVHNPSGFYFLCFSFPCFWQEGGGREALKTPPSLRTIIFFFLSGVYCHISCSALGNQDCCIRTRVS